MSAVQSNRSAAVTGAGAASAAISRSVSRRRNIVCSGRHFRLRRLRISNTRQMVPSLVLMRRGARQIETPSRMDWTKTRQLTRPSAAPGFCSRPLAIDTSLTSGMRGAGYVLTGNGEPWLLLQEMTHRVCNKYTAAISVLSLASARASNSETRDALGYAMERLHQYATLHRALQKPVGSYRADLSRELSGLCCVLSRSLLADRGIRLTLAGNDDVELDAERCWLVCLIVSELVTNAAKHAFRERAGEIRIALVREGNHLQCNVSDDGEPTAAPRPGRGTQIVTGLAARLGGSIAWKFGAAGTTVMLSFELTSTHSDAWGLTSVPPSMLVVGGGDTGLLVASIFNAFGSRIQVLEAGPHILPHADADVSAAVAAALRESSIVVQENFGAIESFEKTPTGVRMNFTKDGHRGSAKAMLAVVAVGWMADTSSEHLR